MIFQFLLKFQQEELSERVVVQSLIHQRNKELKLSQIGLIIVAVFICCHSFKWVPNVYELKQSGKSAKEFDWPVWIREY